MAEIRISGTGCAEHARLRNDKLDLLVPADFDCVTGQRGSCHMPMLVDEEARAVRSLHPPRLRPTLY